MTNTAIVKKIENDAVTVMSVRNSSCGDNCAMCGGCKGEQVFTKAYCDISVNVGDIVVVESKTSFVLFALSAVFLFPIILPVTMFLIFSHFNRAISYIMVVVGIAISLTLIAFLAKSKRFNNLIKPRIITVINKK